MDMDAEPVGMEAERFLHPLKPVDRVERGLRVKHHPPLRIDRLTALLKQRVDIRLLDTVAVELGFDERLVGHETSGGETRPDILDVDPRDPLRLFHRLAHRHLGRGHVGDIAALHPARLALAGAEHDQLAAVALLRDHRRHLGRADVQRGD